MKKENCSLIRFHYLAEPFSFTNRNHLRYFLKKLFQNHDKEIERVNYVFCTDDYLLALNQTHLKHDTLTDIITFELSPKGQPLLSDIYISIDRVKENASLFNCSFKNELHRVIFHGALHLCGYKDKTSKQARQMRSMEETCLRQYFVSREIKAFKS